MTKAIADDKRRYIKTWKFHAPSAREGQVKFWHCSIVYDEGITRELGQGWCVQARWGRLGQSGDYSVRRFSTEQAALKYANDRINDKLRKNYYRVDDNAPPLGVVDRKEALPEPVSEWDLF